MKDFHLVDPRKWQATQGEEYAVSISSYEGSLEELLVGAADFLDSLDLEKTALEAIELGVDGFYSGNKELRLFLHGPLPE